MSATIKTICAWCLKVLKDGPPAPLSHGICPDCYKKLFEEDEKEATS